MKLKTTQNDLYYFSDIHNTKFFTDKRLAEIIDNKCLIHVKVDRFHYYRLTFKGLWYALNSVEHIKTKGK